MVQPEQPIPDAVEWYGGAKTDEEIFTSNRPAPAGQGEPVALTDEQMRPKFEDLLEGSLFKRRADNPEEYWDWNVQDDWNLFRDGIGFAERHHGIKGVSE